MKNNKPKVDREIILYGMLGAIAGFAVCMLFAVSKTSGDLTGLGQALEGILPGYAVMPSAICVFLAVLGAIGGAAVGLTFAYLKNMK
jgi:membrane associated rhomboid family serine protease